MISKKILGVRVDYGLSPEDVLNIAENNLLKDGKNHIICTTNPEFIIDAQKDLDFKKIINGSSLSVPDGIGLIYAKKYLERVERFNRNFLFPVRAFLYGLGMGMTSVLFGKSMKEERVTGVDLTYKICELSSKKNYSAFFLGGKPRSTFGEYLNDSDKDMSAVAANEMRKMYPGVNIVGSISKFSRDEKDDSKTIDYIKKCMKEKEVHHIDFLFVAYNHVYQEKWIMRNSNNIPAKISIGCGGTFDYIVGHCKLPPEIYVKKNLGWLYRLIKQPWRVKRILKAFPIFPMKIFLDSIRK